MDAFFLIRFLIGNFSVFLWYGSTKLSFGWRYFQTTAIQVQGYQGAPGVWPSEPWGLIRAVRIMSSSHNMAWPGNSHFDLEDQGALTSWCHSSDPSSHFAPQFIFPFPAIFGAAVIIYVHLSSARQDGGWRAGQWLKLTWLEGRPPFY